MRALRHSLQRFQQKCRVPLIALLGFSVSATAADIKTGLKAYWSFDQKNFKDSVGIFDGTENGSSPIAFVNGKPGFGQAIELDGVDQYIEITGGSEDDLAMDTANSTGNISIAGWFTVNAFDKSWQALIAKGESNNWRIHRNNANAFMAYAGGTGEGTAEGPDVTDGAWHHFVAVSDSTAAAFGTAIYVDGELYSVNANAPNLSTNGKRVMIGENPDARGRYWSGKIDDLAIWDRALTEAEAKSLWNNGAGKALSSFFAPPNDTDNDGMPNDWETQYGLNPNDPSDAAKDSDGDGVSNLDEYKAGTNPTDTTRPTIVTAASSATFGSITLSFSEELDAATVVAGNFTITPSLAVSAAAYKSKVVTLTTAAQAPGGTAYTVAVKGVKDTSKNEVAAGTAVTVFSYLNTTTGVAKISVWENVEPTGTAVDLLYGDPRYPNSPTRVGTLYSMNSRDYIPTDALEQYGAQMDAILTPAESGSYRFFMYSDDASQLFLSTDDKEANLTQIAEETGCCNNFTEPDSPRTSEPIALVAGKKYWLRLVYKEGGGGDYGQVAWRKEGDKTAAASLLPIPGKFLSSPTALPYPANGVFSTRSPGIGAKNVAPDATFTIVHSDGKSPWTAANVSMKLNGAAVTPTFTKTGSEATITYKSASLLASESTQTISLSYPDPAGQTTTEEWSFTVTKWGGPTTDKVKGYKGLLLGTAAHTADKGGRTGAAGDYGMDLLKAGGVVNVADASFANPAAATDKLSVSLWQKVTLRAASSFWFNSPSSSGTSRGFQAHIPWSDATIYFDTAGCCDVDLTRINLAIDQYSGYSGDATWWNSWHHFAFVKNGSAKEIYIDGRLFHSGSGNPLPADFTNLVIGGGPLTTDNRLDGTVDDFAVYGGALTAAQVDALAKGGAPSAVSSLIAWWDFNDPPSPVSNVKLTVTRAGNNVTITSEPAALPAGWVLQTAASVTGPWVTQAGATTPATVPIGTGNAYLRAAKP